MGRRLALICGCLLCAAVPVCADLVELVKKTPATPAGGAFERGVQLIAAGRMPSAEAAFRESLQLEGSQGISYVGLADLAFRKGQYKAAEQHFQKALHNDPKNGGIQEAWGRFLFELRRYPEAEAVLRRTAAMEPDNGPVRIALGDALMRGGKSPSEAVKAYREGLRLIPGHAGGHFGLGMALQRSGQLDQAKAEFELSAQFSPKSPMPLQAIGELLLARKDTDGALRAFQSALDRNPKYYLAHLSRGDVYHGRKDCARAILEYSQAAQIAPKLALPNVKLGLAREVQGNRAEAKKSYLDAIALDNQASIAYNNLAWMAAESQSDLDNALVWARRAVALAPESPIYLDTLGWVQHLRGSDPEAFTLLQRGAASKSATARVFYHLGVVAELLGKRSEAKSALSRALQLDASFAEARDARERLSRLSR